MLIYKEQLPEDTMDVRLLELPFSCLLYTSDAADEL